MATEHLFYTISHRSDGWHAGPVGHASERVFASKEEALRWCKAQAQQGSVSAAPEEGAYADVEVEIRSQE